MLTSLTMSDISNLVVTILALAGCYLLVKLFFQYSQRSTPESVRQLLLTQLEEKRYAERLPEIVELEHREHAIDGDIARLELMLETVSEDQADEAAEEQRLQRDLESKKKQLAETQKQVDETKHKHRLEAHQYAKQIVDDLGENSFLLVTERSRLLVIQYVTITVIIATVLVLAVLQILTGEQVAPILAAIAGYVLGKTTSQQTAS